MPGKVLALAATHGLSIFSAHTNLDSAEGGLNDRCAECIGLQGLRVLSGSGQADHVKLAFFVPVEHESRLLETLAATSAGTLGCYACCSFSVRGMGRFKPLDGASPFIGRVGEITRVEEVRVEAIVAARDLKGVVDALKKAHPYETMAYDVFPLAGGIGSMQGLGRVGELERPMTLQSFADHVKQRFAVDRVGVAGDLSLPVKTVAVCSGSGSSLIRDFLSSGADVFVSGDLKYHDGMTVSAAGRGLIDVGHFETERLVIDLLVKKLTDEARRAGFDVQVAGYTGERNPYLFL
jgi:dinuclear metal center YbgI/SA1388 family protein